MKISQFLKSAKKPLIVILGPTASGKTDISLKVAHEYNGEIISADSRQIYRGMEIGTDAITKKEQKGIPHHLLGITTPDKPITVAEYKDLAIQKIEEIYKRNHIPLLVGGTGLYISAIIDAYNIPKVKPNLKLREKLQKEAEEKGNEYVHKKLQKLDKKAAAKIHPNNLRYVIRAIEIKLAKPPKSKKTTKPFDVLIIGTNRPRSELYEYINKRVDRQIKRGLTDEVKKLVKKGYDERLPAMTSLGVKEIIPYIKGEMPIKECVEILKQNTRRYAKRQMTWFRRYANVICEADNIKL